MPEHGLTGLGEETGWASIRRYTPADRETVRRICCATAFRRQGARAVFGDERLCADYFSRYYTDIESDLSFVAERRGMVVGYVFGCFDSRQHIAAMARRVVPPVLARAVSHVVLGRFRESALRRYLLWALLWSWRETLPVSIDRFPGHYHVNVLPDGQNQQLYSRLSLAFLGAFEARGGAGVHGHLMERRDGGAFNRVVRQFVRACPDAQVIGLERPTQFARIVLGSHVPVVTRAFCFDNGDFRRLMVWGAPRYGF